MINKDSNREFHPYQDTIIYLNNSFLWYGLVIARTYKKRETISLQ